MLDRLLLGEVADKPHTVLRDAAGALRYEECFTRAGFDGAYTIAYHAQSPAADVSLEASQRGWAPAALTAPSAHRRLFGSDQLTSGTTPIDARTVLLTNSDIDVGIVRPSADDNAFLANNDGDDLYYLHQGAARLESPFGALDCAVGDYVWIPRSLPHRFTGVQPDSLWLSFEVKHGLKLPAQYLNAFGQLRMDAPYSHRDFKRPTQLPKSAAPSTVILKRRGQFFERQLGYSILDVVGLDGFVYPLAFPIERFQPKTGMVHLPPPVHATFVAHGLVVCSFVPRMTDTHPQAIPCPYPHSSVDCDEVLFYARGNFTSRRGVTASAISLHPAGTPHGPHPGAYEASIGSKETHELAVMVDTFQPLVPTHAALAIERPDYHASWRVTT